MNCDVCGDPCRCPSESGPEVLSASNFCPDAVSPTAVCDTEDGGVEWRSEVSARLSKYRTRRKAAPPRYPSLRLPFDPAFAPITPDAPRSSSGPAYETVANRALAPDFEIYDEPAQRPAVAAAPSQPEAIPEAPAPVPNRAARASAKILEFPRLFEPAPRPVDELAEPVMERPRILEVPEVAPPLPALGGITIEIPDPQELEKRPGIEIPMQAAPVSRRVLAAAIDGGIIVASAAFFGLVFWKMTGLQPPRWQSIGLAIGVPSVFWAAYHYLLVVYSAATPGLRLAGLEIQRFDGTLPHRRLRRWRVLASYLSAISLGMGYLWGALDEDGLCWHDRITHTYLAPRSAVAQ